MAVLVLLPAAAGAGFVAADVGELGILALAAADALGLAGDRRGGEGAAAGADLLGLLVGAVAAGTGVLELHAAGLGLGLGALGGLHAGDLFLVADAHARQQHDHVALYLLQQLGEQLEGLALVLLLGLLLGVAAQVDALAQEVHAGQVLLPVLVEHVEHDVALEHAHGLAADALLAGLDVRGDGLLDLLGHALGIDVLLAQVLELDLQAEVLGQGALQALQVPLVV